MDCEVSENMESFRATFLRCLYKHLPFNLKGDLDLGIANHQINRSPDCPLLLSCIINFYGRIPLLEGILFSLTEQRLSKDILEVILVEDRGGTEEGKEIARRFSRYLNIKYYSLTENFGLMGYSRNFGLSRALGRYILFLDDDTVILEEDFLSKLIDEFETTGADALIPEGMASYNLINGRYGFHEPYFPSSRCMAYTREVLLELGGFVSAMIGQEDVEFTIRFIAAGRRYHRSERLKYLHPPLIMDNLNKAKAVGISFAGLKGRYPFFIWLLLIINGGRFLPKLLFPFSLKWKMQGRFSLGFLMGIIQGLGGIKTDYI